MDWFWGHYWKGCYWRGAFENVAVDVVSGVVAESKFKPGRGNRETKCVRTWSVGGVVERDWGGCRTGWLAGAEDDVS